MWTYRAAFMIVSSNERHVSPFAEVLRATATVSVSLSVLSLQYRAIYNPTNAALINLTIYNILLHS